MPGKVYREASRLNTLPLSLNYRSISEQYSNASTDSGTNR